MRRSHGLGWALALGLCLAMGLPAAAQTSTAAPPPPPPPPPPATTAVAPSPPTHPSQTTYPAPPPPAPQPAPVAEPAPTGRQRGRTQNSVWLEVPMFLNVNTDVVRPGFGLAARIGMRIKNFVVPGIGLGASWNPIDLGGDPSTLSTARDPLSHVYFNLGLQFQYENDKFTPYAVVALDFNFWHLWDTGYSCGLWYCYGYDSYRYTPGLTARIGGSLTVNPRMSIDIGLRVGWSGEGNFFESRETYLAPYLGATF